MNLHERDDTPGFLLALLYVAAACLLALFLALLINDPSAVWAGLWS